MSFPFKFPSTWVHILFPCYITTPAPCVQYGGRFICLEGDDFDGKPPRISPLGQVLLSEDKISPSISSPTFIKLNSKTNFKRANFLEKQFVGLEARFISDVSTEQIPSVVGSIVLCYLLDFRKCCFENQQRQQAYYPYLTKRPFVCFALSLLCSHGIGPWSPSNHSWKLFLSTHFAT